MLNLKNNGRELATVCLILILYMTTTAAVRGIFTYYFHDDLKESLDNAYMYYGAFSALVYLTPLIGGYLGERRLGYRLTAQIALILYSVGVIFVGSGHLSTAVLGLSLLATGSGLLMPNMLCLLGNSYKENDKQRDSGFTLAYTSMNVGAMLGYFFSGALSSYFTYQQTIITMSTLVVLAAMFLLIGRKSFEKQAISNPKIFLSFAIIVTTVLLCYALIWHDDICTYGVAATGGIFISFLLLLGVKNWLVSHDSSYLLFCCFGIASIGFWAIYTFKVTLLNIFINTDVNRVFLGHQIPASALLGVNPLLIIALGPFFAWFWAKYSNNIIISNKLNKFLLGLIAATLGFVFLGADLSLSHNSPLPLFSIVLFYLFISIAEIIIAPTGYSLAGELFKKKNNQGIMLGIWNLFTAVGTVSSSLLAVRFQHIVDINKYHSLNNDYKQAFIEVMLICLASAVVLLLPKFASRSRKVAYE